jgi:ubiquinone/menaquinone biosynthesis C-methylase UbiE
MRRPRFIADQARHARGVVGRLIAFVMARESLEPNRRAVEALNVAATDSVLDVGCGPGTALTGLASKARKGRVVGIDPSPLMVEIARRRNRNQIAAGQVSILQADVTAIPGPDSAFDKVMCVHVIYFWESLETGLREIARVLKPGGRAVFLFRTADDKQFVEAFPSAVYSFRTLRDVQQALAVEGFKLGTPGNDCPESPVLLIALRA